MILFSKDVERLTVHMDDCQDLGKCRTLPHSPTPQLAATLPRKSTPHLQTGQEGSLLPVTLLGSQIVVSSDRDQKAEQ